MVYKNQHQVMNRFNIQKMEIKEGDIADFDFHEVVFVAPVPGKEDNSILMI